MYFPVVGSNVHAIRWPCRNSRISVTGISMSGSWREVKDPPAHSKGVKDVLVVQAGLCQCSYGDFGIWSVGVQRLPLPRVLRLGGIQRKAILCHEFWLARCLPNWYLRPFQERSPLNSDAIRQP